MAALVNPNEVLKRVHGGVGQSSTLQGSKLYLTGL